MATRTVTVEQLPGGNFVGGGNDTLMLSGNDTSYFDLSQATFIGFSKIVTDDNFRIKMTSEQFASVSTIEGVWYNYLEVVGSTIDIRQKTITQVWGIKVGSNTMIHADDMSKLRYLDAFNNKNDTLRFHGTLTEANRTAAHNQGYDIVIDDTGLSTTNPPPVISNLAGERQLVQPGQSVFLDISSDAIISDDQGTIRNFTVRASDDTDSLRIIGTDRLVFARNSYGDFDIIFDGTDIGSFSKNGGFSSNAYLYFGFADDAPAEAVNYILQRIEFVRGSTSRYDNVVTISVADKGGRTTAATVIMAGIDGDGTDPGTGTGNRPPSPPILSTSIINESAAQGAAIGRFMAVDPDGNLMSYGIDNDYGGLFRVENGTLVLSGTLDFEQRSSYTFLASASDGRGGVSRSIVTINVADFIGETTIGSDAAEKILGNIGRDKLSGGAGNDTLGGGADSDILTGGLGSDTFLFNATPKKGKADQIKDYNVKADSIWLGKSVFTKLGKQGTELSPAKLNKKFFAFDKAKDKDDYIVYVKGKGKLYYDMDGSGSKAAVEIATLTNKPKLSAAEFFIV